MKKLFLFLFVSLLSTLFGNTQLKTFDELMTSLTNGESVRVVIYYIETDMIIDGEEEKAPEAIGGMSLDTFEYFAKGVVRNEKAFISTSETVLISHPYYGYVYNYVKLRIYEDGDVEIIARYLDPNSYEEKMDEKFLTSLNDGIYFYIN